MSLPCLILAAGFGTRMGGLTRDTPKPLIEVAGRPLLLHALEVARSAHATPIAVNGHYLADKLESWLNAHAPDVEFLRETPRILDSGGAVRNALLALGVHEGPILTLNADCVWRGPNPLAGLMEAWNPSLMDGLLSIIPRAHATGREGGGDFACDMGGHLTFDRSPESAVYTGAQIVASAPFLAERRDVFSTREIWTDMIARGRLHGHGFTGQWADVGHPGGIAAAEAMLKDDADV